MNHKLRLCGELLGLQIGWVGDADSELRNGLRVKLGLAVTEEKPPDLMSSGEVAAYHGCTISQVTQWAKKERLKWIRFRQRRFFYREEGQRIQPPRRAERGPLVPAEPSRRMVRELFEKGYRKAELVAELRRTHFGRKFVTAGTEARVKAAYARLIEAAKTPWRVSAAPTWKMIDEIRRRGYTRREIALALGFHPDLKVGKQMVMPSTEAKVKELYERLRKPSGHTKSSALTTESATR
jgi:hypothetical protein